MRKDGAREVAEAVEVGEGKCVCGVKEFYGFRVSALVSIVQEAFLNALY
jgi:hypothetical protein